MAEAEAPTAGPVYRLHNVVKPYAWGSRSAIAELQGRPTPTDEPEAELWMGAHPLAPSRVAPDGVVSEGRERGLDELIAEDPVGALGEAVVERFGPRLPFLLKVLAAEAPLSIQVHPDAGQAEAGFAREEAAGVARDAAERFYRDPHAKPELIVALTPFAALAGFRPAAAIAAVLAPLAVPGLEEVGRRLREAPRPATLRAELRGLLELARAEHRRLVEETIDACRRLLDEGAESGATVEAARCAAALGERYGDDLGVVLSLFLEPLTLEPGEALFLPPRQVHAYLGGVGIEIMATSDNVLRLGCTGKHVDARGAMAVVDVAPLGAAPILPRRVWREEVWPAPVDDFRLSRLAVVPGEPLAIGSGGPEIVLVQEGRVGIGVGERRLELARGESAFVPAREGVVRVTGAGTLLRARVGDGALTGAAGEGGR